MNISLFRKKHMGKINYNNLSFFPKLTRKEERYKTGLNPKQKKKKIPDTCSCINSLNTYTRR